MNAPLTTTSPATPAAGAPPLAAGRRALCVDDDPTCLRLLRQIMKQAGFAVETARHGVEALAVHACQPVDLVVTDHEMPLKTGLQLVHDLREAHFTGRIVVVSASVTPAIAREYGQLGVTAILRKPYSVTELLAAVRA